jgi:hypothetical protein
MILKGFSKLGDSTVPNDVIENIVQFFDYGLLEADNAVTVQSGTFLSVTDPRYSSGRVWASQAKNFVWESGAISGIYVNGSYYPSSTSGQYTHYIDYPNGRVVFNSGISLTSTVKANYSYKYVSVQRADGKPWFERLIQQNDSDFSAKSGVYEILPENRIPVPTMGVELVKISPKPFQLGGGQDIRCQLLVHCISADKMEADALASIVIYQKDKTIRAFDLNKLNTNNAFPLDYRGVPNSGALTFPQLASSYAGRNIFIEKAETDSCYTVGDLNVHTVKLTTNISHFGV